MIELPFRRLRDDAVVPVRAYEGDAGLDLTACERVELAPGERALVGTFEHAVEVFTVAQGSPSRSPRAMPASSSPAPGSPPRTG